VLRRGIILIGSGSGSVSGKAELCGSGSDPITYFDAASSPTREMLRLQSQLLLQNTFHNSSDHLNLSLDRDKHQFWTSFDGFATWYSTPTRSTYKYSTYNYSIQCSNCLTMVLILHCCDNTKKARTMNASRLSLERQTFTGLNSKLCRRNFMLKELLMYGCIAWELNRSMPVPDLL
jgi:hypothetical protein